MNIQDRFNYRPIFFVAKIEALRDNKTKGTSSIGAKYESLHSPPKSAPWAYLFWERRAIEYLSHREVGLELSLAVE